MIRKMKYISTTFVAFTALFLTTACSNWLDVGPSSEKREEELFSTENGFGSALAGVYEIMAEQALYGGEMTLGFVDDLANVTDEGDGGRSQDVSNARAHLYKEAITELTIEQIWTRQYRAIAHANKIVEWADKNQHIFTGDNHDIVKGEAIALRAFLHFDMLRLFGPVPSLPGAGTMRAIPYKTGVNNTPEKALSQDSVITKILADLTLAEQLLEKDPWQNTTDVEILKYRVNHLNKYATKALLARVYLWKGDKENAAKYANDVIDHAKLSLGGKTLSSGDNDASLLLKKEHLFSLYITKLSDNVKDIISGDGIDDSNRKRLSPDAGQALYGIELDFDNQQAIVRDQRAKAWLPAKGWQPVYFYFYKFDEKYTGDRRTMPIIRLSEMYLVAAEADLNKGESLYQKFTTDRNNQLTDFTRDNIIQEYHREFIGEGQLFYAYKRVNAPRCLLQAFGTDMNAEKYVLPLPKAEQAFN